MRKHNRIVEESTFSKKITEAIVNHSHKPKDKKINEIVQKRRMSIGLYPISYKPFISDFDTSWMARDSRHCSYYYMDQHNKPYCGNYIKGYSPILQFSLNTLDSYIQFVGRCDMDHNPFTSVKLHDGYEIIYRSRYKPYTYLLTFRVIKGECVAVIKDVTYHCGKYMYKNYTFISQSQYDMLVSASMFPDELAILIFEYMYGSDIRALSSIKKKHKYTPKDWRSHKIDTSIFGRSIYPRLRGLIYGIGLLARNNRYCMYRYDDISQ